MATLTKFDSKNKAKAIEKAIKEGYSTLAGGLQLAEGKHKLVVAGGERDAFALLNVIGAAGTPNEKKWALPIVAGTVTSENGVKTTFVLSDKPGAKTLVIADQFFNDMQPNGSYIITVETRKGRKVVTDVVADGELTTADAEEEL